MVKIKICGLTDRKSYIAAQNIGVDYTGFIFVRKSRRFVTVDQVKEICRGVDGVSRKVGVFVNETVERIEQIYKDLDLDLVQLHGDETPDYCSRLNIPYMKVFRIKDAGSITRIRDYDCEQILLDTFRKNEYGGTGKAFDHSVLKGIQRVGKKIFVAGGVSLQNIEEILRYSPYGVDINSSVETAPGIKDIVKMEAIVEKIRELESNR